MLFEQLVVCSVLFHIVFRNLKVNTDLLGVSTALGIRSLNTIEFSVSFSTCFIFFIGTAQILHPAVLNVLEYRDANFTCSFSTSSEYLINWYINDTFVSRLPANHRVVVVGEDHVMTISNVTALLNGTKYVCQLVTSRFSSASGAAFLYLGMSKITL